tara:strand:+ start:641 stop:1003 length:363 start_codon:yes stop_codon:yes gene_type:complete
MAKFKKRKTRTVYKKRPRRSRRNSGGGLEKGMGASFVYGAARAKVAATIAPYAAGLPGGALADELMMGLFNYGVYKYGPSGLRNVAKVGLFIESAQAGQFAASGMMNGSGAAASDGIPTV